MRYTVEIVDNDTGKGMTMGVDRLSDLNDPSALSALQRTKSIRTPFQWFVDQFQKGLSKLERNIV